MCYVHNQWYDISFATMYDFNSTIFDRNAFLITDTCMKIRKFLLERNFRENLQRLSKMAVKFG